jgi:hypothetical protein
LAAAVTLAALPAIAQLDQITSREAVSGLKAALERGSQAAVAVLGRADGFLGNPQVKIPLPESLQSAERLMRRFGMGSYADDLIVTLNRAAETAVAEARPLLLEAVKKMTIKDAKGILAGGDTAATEYFRRTTLDALRKRFRPVVASATARVELAAKYNEYADTAAAFGLLKEEDANLDDYVTRKALDGLFFMVAEEEKKIRKDPVGAASTIIRKVFGAVR